MIHSVHDSFSLTSDVASAVCATPATSRRDGRIIENWQNLLRTNPVLYINLLAPNSSRRFLHFLVLTTSYAIVAFSVRGNLYTDRGCPNVCHIAEELHRTLSIPVLQFTI